MLPTLTRHHPSRQEEQDNKKPGGAQDGHAGEGGMQAKPVVDEATHRRPHTQTGYKSDVEQPHVSPLLTARCQIANIGIGGRNDHGGTNTGEQTEEEDIPIAGGPVVACSSHHIDE